MLRYFGIERGEFPTVVVAVAPPEDLKKGDMFRLDQSDPSRNLTVLQCQAAPSAASHSSSAGAQAHGHCTERRAASGGDGPVGAGQTCLAGAGAVQLMATVCVGLGGLVVAAFGCMPMIGRRSAHIPGVRGFARVWVRLRVAACP